MLKYLEKVKLASETASNGQECVDKVFSKEPGYYSLIIVCIACLSKKVILYQFTLSNLTT